MKGKFRWKFNLFIILTFLLPETLSYGQNLVPNPGFENPVSPSFNGEKGNWLKVCKTDTPDYFNFVDSVTSKLFSEFQGGTKPYEGNACIGIFCFRNTSGLFQNDTREFIQVELTQTMEKDKDYEVSLQLILDPESNVAIDGMGVYLSEKIVSLANTAKVQKIIPQIENPKRNYLRDKENWMCLSGNFHSTGNEKWLVIGNFKSDKNTQLKRMVQFSNSEQNFKKKWELEDDEKVAYYYIDAVSVRNITSEPPILTNSNTLEIDSSSFFLSDSLNKTNYELLFKGQNVDLKEVYFEFGKSTWSPKSEVELERLFIFMIEYPNIRLEIIGYTDDIGSENFNMELSLARANSIANFLISKGIKKERMITTGLGSGKYNSTNITEAERAKNRKVELKILL